MRERVAAREPYVLAGFLLAATVIPVGDAVIVLRRGGQKSTAYGVHGATAAAMVATAAILLRYGEGDWNALHRDLYGDLVFPLQIVVNLNEPGVDHTGGEFLLMEQRPRAQSRGTATLIPHCHGFLFTTRDRPVQSARGWSAAPVRHGVSVIRSGQRHTLGLVFHDAR